MSKVLNLLTTVGKAWRLKTATIFSKVVCQGERNIDVNIWSVVHFVTRSREQKKVWTHLGTWEVGSPRLTWPKAPAKFKDGPRCKVWPGYRCVLRTWSSPTLFIASAKELGANISGQNLVPTNFRFLALCCWHSAQLLNSFFTICNQKSRRSPATANSMFCFAFLHRVWCLSCDEYGAVDGSDVGSSWSLNWSSRPGVPIFSTPSTHAFSLLQCLHTYRWLDGVNLLGLLEWQSNA